MERARRLVCWAGVLTALSLPDQTTHNSDGPAYTHDATWGGIDWISRWESESIALGGNDYSHPTQIRFVIGDQDSSMQEIAAEWHNRLVLNPSNDVGWKIIENTVHKVYDTQQGRDAILSAIVDP